jgi:hypothetical protein
MKRRLNVFLQLEHAYQLAEIAAVKGVSKSSLVAAALSNFLSPEIAEQRELAGLRRLEQLLRQFERLDRDQMLLIEMVALFIRHYLATTLPVAETHQDAARAQCRARFEQFIEQLARHLQRGTSALSALTEGLGRSNATDPNTTEESAS